MITAYISIGSNIDREYYLPAGVKAVAQLASSWRMSRVFEAEPVGFDGDNFFNSVIEIKTSLSLATLQLSLKNIERQLGRPENTQKNQSRTIDLDILLYGDVICECSPTIPRSDLYKFAFVLWPMNELCPELVIPGQQQTIAELWQHFSPQQSLWPVE
ncbi:2-amino-4-hydroxy-6-hydroxymethyldihydropteridine diphosphokinase [Photobacterium carnosum]|uniref:2-amino-4-hydroxy-6-hydroxymethyldihydropteridine diphosphokinase n=1 Tax=Photobacterium carnosum TaxID=2023717 RepID=A0A2N4UR57_9GAMM|nr:2-amino-4-hydroxy-6-hydroxymethyldihydropteridine diphosphokinase [Photobacterium carnosum]KAE8176472.1 2-amino-4-hydroxy-6-hydroxymethyldihydropteridine diphosphokinase [Photobacterium carnosum]MBY3788916.1 2-amino-4-hydroxy-6-hydroxymethyldihydropteridine diphosphokinase [Photobacterium carnosum]MCD9499706.1 2-amino-4-hydroxy-6-hydroxymethyldihydropteridine diphosphokinase [Photobacterium carnosum]MCD9515205.1 2-amino-4-hydroxy-6-hydroxymethyldihydropteridine diphosphokinase [Photobacteriu